MAESRSRQCGDGGGEGELIEDVDVFNRRMPWSVARPVAKLQLFHTISPYPDPEAEHGVGAEVQDEDIPTTERERLVGVRRLLYVRCVRGATTKAFAAQGACSLPAATKESRQTA